MHYLVMFAKPESNITLYVTNKETDIVENTVNFFFSNLISVLQELKNNYDYNKIILLGNLEYCKKIKEIIDNKMTEKYEIIFE